MSGLSNAPNYVFRVKVAARESGIVYNTAMKWVNWLIDAGYCYREKQHKDKKGTWTVVKYHFSDTKLSALEWVKELKEWGKQRASTGTQSTGNRKMGSLITPTGKTFNKKNNNKNSFKRKVFKQAKPIISAFKLLTDTSWAPHELQDTFKHDYSVKTCTSAPDFAEPPGSQYISL